jgi:hypothetical protein
LPLAPEFPKRRIAIVVSDPDDNILYSNAWQGEKARKFNAAACPLIVDARAVEARIPAKVGGEGEGSGIPAAGTDEKPEADITGMYEAFVGRDANLGREFPFALFQINVAGAAVAGWWAPPPDRVTLHDHLKLPHPPMPAPLQSGKFGVFPGRFRDGRYTVFWGETDHGEDPRSDRIGTYNPSPAGRFGTGTLRVLEKGVLELALIQADHTTKIFLKLTDPTSRWSNTTLRTIVNRDAQRSDLVRRAMIARQQQPIPLAFWQLLMKDLAQTGILGKAIVEYESTSESSTHDRRRLREDISRYLEKLAGVDEYTQAVHAHFVLFAATTQLAVKGGPLGGGLFRDDVTISVYAWLMKIAQDFMDDVLKGGGKPEAAIAGLPVGFKDLGLVPDALFTYKIKFESMGGEFEIPKGKGAGGGVYLFEATITRTVSPDSKRPPQVDLWQGAKKQMWGRFGDLGVSVGLKIGSESGMLDEVEFKSFRDIRPQNFNYATFYTIAASALKGKIFLFEGSVGSSAVMVMTVHASSPNVPPVEMTAGVDKWLDSSVGGQIGGLDEKGKPKGPDVKPEFVLFQSLRRRRVDERTEAVGKGAAASRHTSGADARRVSAQHERLLSQEQRHARGRKSHGRRRGPGDRARRLHFQWGHGHGLWPRLPRRPRQPGAQQASGRQYSFRSSPAPSRTS